MRKCASSSTLTSSTSSNERATRGNQVEQFLIKCFDVIEQSRVCGCKSLGSSCLTSSTYPPSDLNSLVTKLRDGRCNSELVYFLRNKTQYNSLFELLQREGPSICIGTNLDLHRIDPSRRAQVTLELWYIQIAKPTQVFEPALLQISHRLASALKSLIAITRALPASRLLRPGQRAELPLPTRVQQLRRPATSPRPQRVAETPTSSSALPDAGRSDPLVPPEMVLLPVHFFKEVISTSVGAEGVSQVILKAFSRYAEFLPTAIQHTRCASVLLTSNFELQVGCYYLSSEAIAEVVARESLTAVAARRQSVPVSINTMPSSVVRRTQARRSAGELRSSGGGQSCPLSASPIHSDPSTLNPVYEHEDEMEPQRLSSTTALDAPSASSAIAVPLRRNRSTTEANAPQVAFSADSRLPFSDSPRAKWLAQRYAADAVGALPPTGARRALDAGAECGPEQQLYEGECRQLTCDSPRQHGDGARGDANESDELPSGSPRYTLEQRARFEQIEAIGLEEPLKCLLLASECEVALAPRRQTLALNDAARQPSMVASALAWCLHKSRRRTSSTAAARDEADAAPSRRQSTATDASGDSESQLRSSTSMSASRALWQRFKESRNNARDETYALAPQPASPSPAEANPEALAEGAPGVRHAQLTTSMILSRMGRLAPLARHAVHNALASGATPAAIARSPPADFVLLDAPGVPSAPADGCDDLLTCYLQRAAGCASARAGRAGALMRLNLRFRGRSQLGAHLTTIDAALKGASAATAFFAEFDAAYQQRVDEDEELESPD